MDQTLAQVNWFPKRYGAASMLAKEAVMSLDLECVKRNIHDAGTTDLLDRITAFRQGMEPEAVALIEDELRQRGVTTEDVLAHADELTRTAVYLSDGTAACCSSCQRPAVVRIRGWHHVWSWLPVFPQTHYYCANHKPAAPGRNDS
jgi:hypothetical protein